MIVLKLITEYNVSITLGTISLDQGSFILEPTRTASYNLSMTILKCKALSFHQSGCQNQELPFKFLQRTKLFLLLTLDAKLPSVTAQYFDFLCLGI